jgi:hypothetical protein
MQSFSHRPAWMQRHGRNTLVTRKLTQLMTCAALAVALSGFATTAAQAATDSQCDAGQLSQPFTHWADFSEYAQVPGGRFESGLSGWQTSGGARVVSDNESWNVSGAGSNALELPAGASAQSPSFCGGLAYPTVRMFARSAGRSLFSGLSVSILYTDRSGILRSLPLGIGLPSAGWQPTLPMLTLSGLPLLTGSGLAVRITAIGGAFAIDDVYVDPFCRMR